MRLRHLTFLAGALGLGCGASPQHSAEQPSSLEVRADPRITELHQHELALDAILLGVPNCAEACEHLSALCALAAEICELSRTSPEQVSEAQCTDANGRCERGTTRVSAQCQCQTEPGTQPTP